MLRNNLFRIAPLLFISAAAIGCGGGGGTTAGTGPGGTGGPGVGGQAHLTFSALSGTNVNSATLDATNVTSTLANGGKELIISAMQGTLPNRLVTATITKSTAIAVGDTFVFDGVTPAGMSFSENLSASSFHAWASTGGSIKITDLTSTKAGIQLNAVLFSSDDPNSTGTFKLSGTVLGTALAVK